MKPFQVLSLFLAIWALHGASVANGHRKVQYCDLFTTSRYNGQNIVTKAILIDSRVNQPIVDGGERFFFSAQCNNRDYFGLASLGDSVPNFLHNTSSMPSTFNGPRLYEIEFKARFTISLSPSFGHLDFFRARFDVISIRFAREVTENRMLPDLRSASPIIEATQSLQAVNQELLSWVFGGNTNAERERFLPRSAQIFLNEKEVSISDLREVFNGSEPGEIVQRTSNISRVGPFWEVKGSVEVKSRNAPIERTEFISSFILNDHSDWKLDRLVMKRLSPK